MHDRIRATAINNIVDTGPTGFSPGDLYVFSDRYFLAGDPGLQVGTVDGRCALIDPATVRFDCSVTNTLSGAGGLEAGDVMCFRLANPGAGRDEHIRSRRRDRAVSERPRRRHSRPRAARGAASGDGESDPESVALRSQGPNACQPPTQWGAGRVVLLDGPP
jgi:hypothetical protein